MKANKINSRSPIEADSNKGRSLRNRGTMKFNINLRQAFNGGAKILKNETQIHSTSGGL